MKKNDIFGNQAGTTSKMKGAKQSGVPVCHGKPFGMLEDIVI